jgi:hypothetical protein
MKNKKRRTEKLEKADTIGTLHVYRSRAIFTVRKEKNGTEQLV